MTERRYVCAAIVAAVVAYRSPAHACSCGSFDELSVARCSASKRVFAGTVARYNWPSAFDLVRDSRQPVRVELDIDSVWKGELPTTLFASTGYGCCDCSIAPVVGTRFVVCDDEAADAAPSFEMCSAPAFDAPALEAALGPAKQPFTRLTLGRDGRSLTEDVLTIPMIAVVIAALLGRIARRRRTRRSLRWRTLALGLFACGVITVALRLVAHVRHNFWLSALGPAALATVLGCVIAFEGHRRRVAPAPNVRAIVARRWVLRGPSPLAAAFLTVAFVVWVGYRPAHVPWDQPGAIECSRSRAEAILAKLAPDEEIGELPRACTDWAHGSYDKIGDRCLGFPDGDGGEQWTCIGDSGLVQRLSFEQPW
jgi:hypothetical protein